jgi:RNA polymerase sigma-70 factor (ECF subfamily)
VRAPLTLVAKPSAPKTVFQGDDAAPKPFVPKTIFQGDDAALVRAFRQGDKAARAEFYDRYADHVHRVLYRLLGFQSDLADLHHDVFVRALGSLPRLFDPSALKGWLTMIAVHVARSSIAKRRRGRWLWFLPDDELPEAPSAAAPGEVVDALRATYAILDRLPVDDRVAFALRFIDGMELTEVAAACETSLATIKRRLARASARFEREARQEPVLTTWLEGGTRWGSPSNP